MDNAARKLNEKTTLDDIVLSKEDIKAMKIPVKQVFEILEDGTKYSPLWQEDLKAYLRMNGTLFNSAKVRAYGDEEWTNLAGHPTFSRRGANQSDKLKSQKNRFHLLLRGVKQGPFTEKEVKDELTKRTILYTDFVSIDDGVIWHKLYQVKDFDRRGEGPTELPASPNKQTLMNTKNDEDFDSSNKTNMALAGLAKISQSAKNQKIKSDAGTNIAYIANKFTTGKRAKLLLASFSLTFILGLIIFAMSDPNSDDPFKNETAKIILSGPVTNPADTSTNSDKNKNDSIKIEKKITAKKNNPKRENRSTSVTKVEEDNNTRFVEPTFEPEEQNNDERKSVKAHRRPSGGKRKIASTDGSDDSSSMEEEEVIEEVFPEDINKNIENDEQEFNMEESKEDLKVPLQYLGDDGTYQDGEELYD